MRDRNADWTLCTVKSTKIARESDGLHDRFYVTIVKHYNKECDNSLSILQKKVMLNIWSFADIS